MTAKIRNLSQGHQEIKRLTAQGWSTKRVAELLGMHPESVRQIKASPLFRKALAGHQMSIDERIVEKTAEHVVHGDPVRKILEGAKVGAAQKVVSLMQLARSEKIQSDNAWEILKHAGYQPKESGAGSATQIVIPINQVLVLNQALAEIGDV